jgi:hypothetical protein
MKELELARLWHDQLDSEYAKRLFRATSRGQVAAIRRFQELRRINDGAYFLIIFGTFERYVTEKAEVAVKARTKKSDYRHRRAWETLLNQGKLNTSFLNRVRVVLDQQSQDFGRIRRYYDVRNDLAHEGVTQKLFNIPGVVSDLRAAIRQMKP